MATQRDLRTRSLQWENGATTEPRSSRGQQRAPLNGRGLPGMPLEMPEFDDAEELLSSGMHTLRIGAPWWRPETRFGRILLAMGLCLVLGVGAFAYYRAKTFLERDNRFRITGSGNIEANGLGEVTRGELLPVFGEDIGRNIFFVPLAERRKQLEQIPWVESATVMRLLPDQIRVSIVERTPVAFVRQGQKINLVDRNGVLLDMPAAALARHHFSFPVVSGVHPDDPAPMRRARMDTYERLIADLDSTGQHYSNQISEIDLSDPEDAKVTLPAQGSDILAHFGESDFLARYERYRAHIADWRQQYPQLKEVDLRYGQQVVLEMNHDGTPATMSPESTANKAAGVTQSAVQIPIAKPSAAEPMTESKKPSAARSVKTAKTAEKASEKASTKPPEKPGAKPMKKVVESASTRAPTKESEKRTSAEVKAHRTNVALNKPVHPVKAASKEKPKANTSKAKTSQAAREREIERKAKLMRERRERARSAALRRAHNKATPKASKSSKGY